MEQPRKTGLDEALKSRLEARFGQAMLEDGFTIIPNRALDRYRAVGMTPTEFTFWATVMRFQYGEEPPFPSINTLAAKMGRSHRSIERYIKHLEEKGLLVVMRGQLDGFGHTTNSYDFTPLYDKIVALAGNIAGQGVKRANIAGQGVKRPVEPTGGDKMSRKCHPPRVATGASEATDLPTILSADVSRGGDACIGFSSGNTAINGESLARARDSNQEDITNNREDSKGYALSPTLVDLAEILPEETCREVRRISKAFGDAQHIKANVTQAQNLFSQVARRGMTEEDFTQVLIQLEQLAAQADITRRNKATGDPNRMPYFFALLRSGIAQLVETWDAEDQAARTVRDQQRRERVWRLMRKEFPTDYHEYLALRDAGQDEEAEAFLAPFLDLADEQEVEAERRWQAIAIAAQQQPSQQQAQETAK